MAERGDRRRTFGPAVLLGLASAAFAAYAATRPWATGSGGDSVPGGATMVWGEVSSSPLGTALALVVLACWGVVLVTRRRFRRAIAWLSVLAALGYVAAVVWAPFSLPDHLREQVRRRTGSDLETTSLTGWFWLALVAGVLVVASTAAAARLVGSWPEMGAKYDAPTGSRSAEDGPAADDRTEVPTENIDIWKALDEGRDPTA